MQKFVETRRPYPAAFIKGRSFGHTMALLCIRDSVANPCRRIRRKKFRRVLIFLSESICRLKFARVFRMSLNKDKTKHP